MDQHAAGMYYIACCNWQVDAPLCMYRCTGLLQRDLMYNLQLFQQACKHTGLQLVSACDYFAFWSWDATLWHSCLYSALRLGLFIQFAVYEIVFSNCMSSSRSYPRQLFLGKTPLGKRFVVAVNVFSQSCQASSIFVLSKVHPSQNAIMHCTFFEHGLYE